MTLFAKDRSGKVVTADSATKQADYFCIGCGGPVTLRRGRRRLAHFSHRNKEKYCLGKSQTHMQIQLSLQRLFPRAELEVAIGRRVADCYVPDHNLVFEVQCSSITQEEIKAREDDYHALGLNIVWLFHASRFKKPPPAKICYMTTIDKHGRGIIYDQINTARRISKKQIVDLARPIRDKGSLSFHGDCTHSPPKEVFKQKRRRLFLKKYEAFIDYLIGH